jgi:hypothetical protein
MLYLKSQESIGRFAYQQSKRHRSLQSKLMFIIAPQRNDKGWIPAKNRRLAIVFFCAQ